MSRNARISWCRACDVSESPPRQLLAGRVGLGPLVLLFVQLLEVGERVLVLGIEPQHFGERLERPIDEAAALVVEAEAQQHVGVFELAQVRRCSSF